MIHCWETLSGFLYFLHQDTNIKKGRRVERTRLQVNLEEGIKYVIYCQETMSGLAYLLPLFTNIKKKFSGAIATEF